MLSRFVSRLSIGRQFVRSHHCSSRLSTAEAPAVNQEIRALQEKAKGPWKSLSAEEKTAIYRQSFDRTVAEHRKPDPARWPQVVAGTAVLIFFAVGLYTFLKKNVAPPVPHTVTKEWQEAQKEKMLRQLANPIEGMSSKKQ